jgi:N-acetylglucosamine malate deacetylase 2
MFARHCRCFSKNKTFLTPKISKMKIMYIFPHPDDESFGPAGVIYKQVQDGHEVILLTFTKGGATKVRHQLGLSIQEMGLVREKEMEKVQKTLQISKMTVLDYEDGGLSQMNPLTLEAEVKKWLICYQPDVVVTYPAHGGSGHHDHIALHHVIKRLFYEKLSELAFWKRLAFFTVIDTGKPMFLEGGVPRVTQTQAEDVLVTVELEDEAVEAMKNALLCYETYQEVVKNSHVIERIGRQVHFELAHEKPTQRLNSLTDEL